LSKDDKIKLLTKFLLCTNCGAEFSGVNEREEHAIYNPGCSLVCSFQDCGETFFDFQQLLDHLETSHAIQNIKTFYNKQNLFIEKKTKCRICQKVFRKFAEIDEHFKKDHPGRKPFECDVCGYNAKDEARLKKHELCHKQGGQKEQCNICFKEFRNKVSLRTHRNMVHKMGKQYTCSYCGKILYSSQYVKKHEATHTGQKFKAATCKYCGKTVEYTKLKNHELIHTGEKPFKCSDCSYRCIQRSNLRIHMRAVHKKELPKLAVGQKRYSGQFMDGTAANNDPFDLRSVFHK